MEDEKNLSDKTETELKMDLQMTGYKNGIEKMLQKKPTDILIIKMDIQTITKRVTWMVVYFSKLGIQKRFVKALKNLEKK